MRSLILAALAGALVVSQPILAAEPPPKKLDAKKLDPVRLEHFEKRIRPVLIAHCYGCHSAEAAAKGKLKGGLALDTRDGLLAGGDSGPAIVPGKPDKSSLLAAMRFEDLEMPPEGKLSAAVLADFEQWIADGAVDPRDGAVVASRTKVFDFAREREFWSFRPLARPEIPAVRDAGWPAGDIDRFVLARLEQEGLAPVVDADRGALLRRLHFDLTGLPPSPETLRDFHARSAQDPQAAYEGEVDRLLASPAYGERWGRHWLDVVRFGESNGRDINVIWHHAWRYRDWVIDAFNRDLPFDQFIRDQIAGDLLPSDSAQERDARTIATGVLAMTPKLIEETNRKVYQMDLLDEQIDVISRAFVGLSISCARCHDHKFDPIPTRDYYALAGILASTKPLYGPARIGVKGSPHSEYAPVGPDVERLAPKALEHWQQLADAHLKFNTARADRYRVVRDISDLEIRAKKPGADAAALAARIAERQAEVKDWDERIKKLGDEIERLLVETPPQPGWALAVRDSTSVDVAIHIRGETTNLGEVARRGVPQIIQVAGSETIPAGESGRRQLAEWLASRQQPLTPRVAVNRVWLHLMGRGLVATPDDFGRTGSAPSHPELLDHLAGKFVADGWSVKRLVRSIVLSRTYRLASVPNAENFQKDPEVALLWRARPRRLEVEAFRDAVLSVAGRLELARPAPYFSRVHPYRDDVMWSFKPFVKQEELEGSYRTVYLPVIRGWLPEIYTLFDFADPNRVTGQRDESIVPAQSLYLMNSPWIIEQARHTASRLLREEADDAARIERLHLTAFARKPSREETSRMLAYLSAGEDLLPAARVNPAGNPSAKTPADPRLERWASLCQIVFASAEFRYLP